MNLNNKVSLVTGSSRGIGSSIVKKLASLGSDIVINYLNSEKESLELKKYLEDTYHIKVVCIKCDISNESDIKNMINEAINYFGRIDILINNASIAIDTLYEDKTKENFMKTLETNLVGTFLVTKYASKYMLDNKCGNIVNISSTNGIDTYYPESIDYDASKAGVISLTHNMAKYYAPYLRVNCICPGWVNTDMNKNLSAEFKEKELSSIYLNRFADKEEIASVVAFLVSDEASYINNSIIRVDGGYNG